MINTPKLRMTQKIHRRVDDLYEEADSDQEADLDAELGDKALQAITEYVVSRAKDQNSTLNSG